MRLFSRYVLAAALGSLSASEALAQLTPVRPFPQSNPQTSFPGGFGTPLFQHGNVSQGLRLTPQQLAQLNEVNYQLQAQFQRETAQTGRFGDPQRNLRMQELRYVYDAELLRSAGTIMTPEQFNRYQELGLANRGYDVDLLRRLNATETQLQRVQTLGWPNGANHSVEILHYDAGHWWHGPYRNAILNGR